MFIVLSTPNIPCTVKRFLIFAWSLLTLLPLATYAQVWVEAEGFSHYGGWKMDGSAFTKIGSACLNAHGMGCPVADAWTAVAAARPGTYHVYVRTYNWTAPWYKGAGPGAFQLVVNGKALPARLGTVGTDWQWQYAGKVRLERSNRLVLHDLTGFNGRVDAVCFMPRRQPPVNATDRLCRMRRRLLGVERDSLAGRYDLVVAGGGVAGCATALTAARYGLRVALVDNLPELGGNNYLGVGMCGVMCYNLYPQLGKAVRELSGIPETYFQQYGMERVGNGNGYPIVTLGKEELASLRERILRQAGVDIFHNFYVCQASHKDRHITAITATDLLTQRRYRFAADYFADCTGDGDLAFLAGADYHLGREARSFANEPRAPLAADRETMGGTLEWYSKEMKTDTAFFSPAQLPWAVQCSKNYHFELRQWQWTWETGFHTDNATDAEAVRDNMLRAIYGNWAWLKTNLPAYRHSVLDRVGYRLMKRESRRVMGEYVLNENDISQQVAYPDASFTTTWTMDVHRPQPVNEARYGQWAWQAYSRNDDTATWIRPYHVPYRVLVARDFDNLFIGGRCMSVTHVALGTVRVQATLGMAGEVTGMAAAVCVRHGISPIDVYRHYWTELAAMMKKGVPATVQPLTPGSRRPHITGNSTLRLPADTTSLLRNPCMGWGLYDDADGEVAQARDYWHKQDSLGATRAASFFYLRWRWSDMEPSEGHYAWRYDNNYKQLVAMARRRGLKLAFRIYFNSKDNSRQATPQYVRQAGAQGRTVDGLWSPYIDDPVFRAKFKKFVEAFAKEYDCDSVTDFVDGVGAGWWGECHHLNLKDQSRKAETLEWFTQTYGSAFSHVPLVMPLCSEFGIRLETGIAQRKHGYAFRRDGLGSQWFLPSEKAHANSLYPKSLLIGEQCYWKGDDSERFPYVDKKYHFTRWRQALEAAFHDAINCHFNTLDLREPVEAKRWLTVAPDLVQAFIRHGGYRLWPYEASVPANIVGGDSVAVASAWRNMGTGILPNDNPRWGNKYRVAYALIDDKGRVAARWVDKDTDPANMLPGRVVESRIRAATGQLPPGQYIWGVAIVDTHAGCKPAIRLATKRDNIDGWTRLTEVNVR